MLKGGRFINSGDNKASMAQKYQRRSKGQASRARIETRVPAWVWLFTGAVLGAFIMFLIRLSETDTATQPDAPVAQKQVSEPAAKQLPRFDFYDLLKETKVEIPEIAEQEPISTEEASPEVEYILQVASFRGKRDAEQLRAELILLNLDAQVEQAKIRNGETWHRVLVGPFISRSRLAKARSTLVSHNHDALVLKRAKQG